MATLAIHDRTGEVGKYEIDPAQIAPRISKQLIHDAVVMYQNNLRLGTVRTKNRTDVTGHDRRRCIGRRGRATPAPVLAAAAFAGAADTSTPCVPATGRTA